MIEPEIDVPAKRVQRPHVAAGRIWQISLTRLMTTLLSMLRFA